jgi:hypothetical protein
MAPGAVEVPADIPATEEQGDKVLQAVALLNPELQAPAEAVVVAVALMIILVLKKAAVVVVWEFTAKEQTALQEMLVQKTVVPAVEEVKEQMLERRIVGMPEVLVVAAARDTVEILVLVVDQAVEEQ